MASFAVFKYLTLYGLIQFIGTALLYWVCAGAGRLGWMWATGSVLRAGNSPFHSRALRFSLPPSAPVPPGEGVAGHGCEERQGLRHGHVQWESEGYSTSPSCAPNGMEVKVSGTQPAYRSHSYVFSHGGP